MYTWESANKITYRVNNWSYKVNIWSYRVNKSPGTCESANKITYKSNNWSYKSNILGYKVNKLTGACRRATNGTHRRSNKVEFILIYKAKTPQIDASEKFRLTKKYIVKRQQGQVSVVFFICVNSLSILLQNKTLTSKLYYIGRCYFYQTSESNISS